MSRSAAIRQSRAEAGDIARQGSSGTRSYPAPYARGAAVTVLYRPAAPADAAIDAFWSLWPGPVICGSIGVVFLAFSLLLL